MILYTPEEIKKIMEDNFEKSMDLAAFYHNLLVAFGLHTYFDNTKEIIGEWNKNPAETWKDNFSMMIPKEAYKPAVEPKKEWEILQGCHKFGLPHKWDSPNQYKTCEENGCDIYSVKRLSDGEEFKVGDEAVTTDGKTKKITAFLYSAKGTNIEVQFSGKEIDYNWLYQISKPAARQPLSKEDKLDIIAKVFAKIMFYSDWKWNTPNERVIEMFMRELGYYPFNNEDEMIRKTAIDEKHYKEAADKIAGRTPTSFGSTEPAKQPLFTSEDGVPIYEDSELWNKWEKLWCCNIAINFPPSSWVLGWKDTLIQINENVGYKFFTTKEAAEKYWEEHKPK